MTILNFKSKKFVISAVITVLMFAVVGTALAVLPKANMKPSDYDIGVTYEQVKNQDKPIVAVFYVDWCTYCKRFMPRLDKVRNINKDKFNFVLINVEDSKNESLVREYRISGYPAVYIIDTKYDNRVHIDNPFFFFFSDLNKEVVRYYNFRNLITNNKSCK